jgi:hypothetical protein
VPQDFESLPAGTEVPMKFRLKVPEDPSPSRKGETAAVVDPVTVLLLSFVLTLCDDDVKTA